MKKFLKLIWRRKFTSLIILAAVSYGGYFTYQKLNPPAETVKYVTSVAKQGMLISSISGAGQISAENQIDIKPKVSGDITNVAVKQGQEVKTGDLIAEIDSQTATRTVSEAASSLATAKLELDELLSPPDKLTLLQAENSVTSAKAALDKLLAPADPSDLLQAENSLNAAKEALTKLQLSQQISYQQARESKTSAEKNLDDAYENAYNQIADVALNLPDIITKLHNIIYSKEIANTTSYVLNNPNNDLLSGSFLSTDYVEQDKFKKYIQDTENEYTKIDAEYKETFDEYKSMTRYSSKDDIESILEKTINLVRDVSDAIKNQSNMLDFWVSYRTDHSLTVYSTVSGYQNSLNTYTTQANSILSTTLAKQTSIADYKKSILDENRNLEEIDHNYPLEITADQRTIAEKEDELAKLKAGADAADIDAAKRSLEEKKTSLEKLKAGAAELEIRNKKIAIQQKNSALAEAKQTLAEHKITAPFDGIIAAVNVKKGDSASSGSAIAVLMTKQKIAGITLNEIDAAQVKTGQKVTLQFDAAKGLSITGEVAEMDTIGTVSQAVVSYNIKIVFNVQDDRIKPGMSVSALIITEAKQDVLLVPITAAKTYNGNSYVEILVNGAPQRKTVIAGISNDTMIEIVSGLNEGEKVITQTIKSGETTAASAPTAGGSSGARPGGDMGNVFRAMR
ncbi:MAG: efflux RND transporter periplasmic adaptor subunit [bacterium]